MTYQDIREPGFYWYKIGNSKPGVVHFSFLVGVETVFPIIERIGFEEWEHAYHFSGTFVGPLGVPEEFSRLEDNDKEN